MASGVYTVWTCFIPVLVFFAKQVRLIRKCKHKPQELHTGTHTWPVFMCPVVTLSQTPVTFHLTPYLCIYLLLLCSMRLPSWTFLIVVTIFNGSATLWWRTGCKWQQFCRFQHISTGRHFQSGLTRVTILYTFWFKARMHWDLMIFSWPQTSWWSKVSIWFLTT